MEIPKISIIGAGPAGIATSIQLKRFGYEPQVFEMDRVGGLLWNANLVENFPGFPKGISGPNLINLMEKHLKYLDIEIQYMEINNLTFEDDRFYLTSSKSCFVSDYVVIASGTKPKPSDIKFAEAAREFIHHDIKKILNLSRKHIVIIGSGDAAFDQAINLSKRNKITIINRGGDLSALQLLVERAFANDNITYSSRTAIENIDLVVADTLNKRHCLKLNLITDGKEKYSYECDEIVFAIGRDPHLEFLGQIIDNNRYMLVGDVINGLFRQATIAIGDGIKTAMKINNQILLRY